MLTPTMSLAQTPQDKTTSSEIDKIFKLENVHVNGKPANEPLKKLSERIGSKQESGFADVFASVIRIFSGLAVVMTFVGAIVAGVIFVFSEGEESRTTKAKSILIYVIIGDLIIAASYAIIRAITYIKPLP